MVNRGGPLRFYGTLRAGHPLFGRVFANGRFAKLELDERALHIRPSWVIFQWFVPSLDISWRDIEHVERRDLSLQIHPRQRSMQPVTFGGQRPGNVDVILRLMEAFGANVDWRMKEESLFGD